MAEDYAEFGDCWKDIYPIVAKVARSEKSRGSGLKSLLQLIEKNALVGIDYDPLPDEFTAEQHLSDLVAAAENNISDSLADVRFKDLVSANPNVILAVSYTHLTLPTKA